METHNSNHATHADALHSATPLCTVELDRAKIWKSIGLRFLTIAVACVLMKDQFDSLPLMLGLFVIYACIILFPLLHLKDQLAYYPNEVHYKGVRIPLPAPDQIRWVNSEYIFTTKYLEFGKRRIDITYLKDAKDLFYDTYSNNND